ncbi:uncharacterized protein C19orf44 homolog [Perognathus longimembris pacificus]|uniref:uncharacterized protein C19orf44 homolog n=1 Tax=Perognathus longimembris pacificus TaxID=214514 RepID=UPI0020194E38|nr:uncharacterized protein C19orf44 homolog [Perognathus longimembris pacificus]XP_048198658.1 uncharacterized protein C19orf44 homolog [Perognathus longimembris pacificus]XP_048198659.1 uncharacterized protein C19orf44 homolog [Perognathus longimembris pacificus]
MASTGRLRYRSGGLFDFSHISLEDSNMEAIRNMTARPNLSQAALGHSRFLKRNPSGAPQCLPGAPGRAPRAISSTARTNAVLTKLAHVESKIRSRRPVPASPPHVDSNHKSTSDGLSYRSFQKEAQDTGPLGQSKAQSGGGSRFLKTRVPPAPSVPPCPVLGTEGGPRLPLHTEPARRLDPLDSDEEEMKELLGSLIESSRHEEMWTNDSLAGPKEGETLRGPAVRALSSPEPSAPLDGSHSTACSTACSTRTNLILGDPVSPTFSSSEPLSLEVRPLQLASLPTSSEVGPCSELGSEAATTASLNDFRVNILFLEDLVPAAGDKSAQGQNGEGAGGGPQAQPWGSPFQGTASPVVGDESQVSEQLGASAASEPHTDPVASEAYSEDFERSPSSSTSEPTLPNTLDAPSELSSSPGSDPLSRLGPGAGATTRGLLKEAAVQTLEPALSYQWSRGPGEATIGPGLGGAYVDPVPIASHVVSADALEALTAYSPTVLVLNELLKQQLGLTQQFIEASRHLHTSLLQSLDSDSFHYHTLEEAKEYIKCHKPAPLTLDAALREVTEELRGPVGAETTR